ncbi:hypothetical protein BGZ49_009573 [Haplosporangium sp. Z 27]|nr:hypothetical protein BGZ49_009573 [Haplosporangium sp. Z 27]
MTGSDSATHKALMVSEIRSQIGSFLVGSNKDIIACMSVCKAWRPDFRRLLYFSLVLTQRTSGSIITPYQWRANSGYTQSLAIEEPALIQRGNNVGKGYRSGKSANPNGSGIKEQRAQDSLDYHMDPAVHCPNLLHLTVQFNKQLSRMCCWTRQGDWYEVDRDGLIEEGQPQEGQEQNFIFKTTSAVQQDVQNNSFLVKTSNRILALLHYHPQLKTFRWIGRSIPHVDQIGRYFLTRQQSQLVELQLEALLATVPEINSIIAHCPMLRRLQLHSLNILTVSRWPELNISDSADKLSAMAVHFAPLSIPDPIPISSSSLSVQQAPQQLSNSILDLRNIGFLVLESPKFPSKKIYIHGPNLIELHISYSNKTEGRRNITAMNSVSPQDSHQGEAYWNCPRLQKYQYHNGSLENSVYTSNILESCRGKLGSLSLISTIVTPTLASDLVVSRHCQTLTYLDFSGSSWIKSDEIQALLCNCPELIEFNGPHGVLWGEDILESGQNWACIKLKKLQMMICMARPDSDVWEQSTRQGRGPIGFPLQGIIGPQLSQYYPVFNTSERRPGQDIDQESYVDDLKSIRDAAYNQLSQLTQLEILDLNGGGFSASQFLYEYPRGIPWTLEAGLDNLRNLSKMKTLVVTGWEDRMKREEVQWFKKHWPDLLSIINRSGNMSRGIVSTDNEIDTLGSGIDGGADDGDDDDDKKPNEKQVIGWLAFRICLAQEWPERFPHANPIVSGTVDPIEHRL